MMGAVLRLSGLSLDSYFGLIAPHRLLVWSMEMLVSAPHYIHIPLVRTLALQTILLLALRMYDIPYFPMHSVHVSTVQSSSILLSER